MAHRSIGDAIAMLDGLAAADLRAPVHAKFDDNGESDFVAYMSDVTGPDPRMGGGSDGSIFTGGSSYESGNQGAAAMGLGDLAGAMAMLDGHAVFTHQLQGVDVQQQSLGMATTDIQAQLRGLGELGASGYEPAFQPIADVEGRSWFADTAGWNLFKQNAGDKPLAAAQKAYDTARAKNSPNLLAAIQKLTAIRLLRAQMWQAHGGMLPPWEKAEVIDAWKKAIAKANTIKQTNGLPGLAGVNAQLAGLEGAVGRRIRRKLKKGFKTVGKTAARGLKTVAKTAVKGGASYFTGGLLGVDVDNGISGVDVDTLNGANVAFGLGGANVETSLGNYISPFQAAQLRGRRRSF